jgi:serine/threonine-protein kinase
MRLRDKRGGDGLNSGFWKSDWLLGVLVVVAFTAANLFSDWIPSLERKAYDVALQSTARAPSDRIAIIAIDQASIDNIVTSSRRT